MNYNEANILIFCIVWPLLFFYFMTLAVLNAHYKTKVLKRLTWISVIITLISPLVLELIIRLRQ